MKKLLLIASILLIFGCRERAAKNNYHAKLDSLAQQYVRLGLTIGKYDPDFVDAYYGPDSLKPDTVKQAVFPKDSLLASTDQLLKQLKDLSSSVGDDTLKMRADWMSSQLVAFGRRIRIFSGEYRKFDEESKELFGVVAPSHPAAYFRERVLNLEKLLPGTGDLSARFQKLAAKFVIPKDKIDTVFKTTIAESRKRTKEHYDLPAEESFNLEYVTGKPWSGYNWYQGHYKSLIQINTDQQILVERAIDVASHESYPGHHVYNMLLEKNLYRDKGWVEISLYPLFSPQSLIAEGSANYGIEVVFPGEEKIRFTREVLLPLAGLDTAGIGAYFKALELRESLSYARNEAARGLIDGSMTEKEAVKWLQDYGLSSEEAAVKSLSFIKKYRSYVINYNYGKDMIRRYIESKGGTARAPEKRWELFHWLLSNPVTPAQLQK